MDSRRKLGPLYFKSRGEVPYLQANRGTRNAGTSGYGRQRAEYIAAESGPDKSFVFELETYRRGRTGISPRRLRRKRTPGEGQY